MKQDAMKQQASEDVVVAETLRLLDKMLSQVEELADSLGIELRNDRRKEIHYDA